jgi:hypothetical protein
MAKSMPTDDRTAPIPILGSKDVDTTWSGALNSAGTFTWTMVPNEVYELRRTPGGGASSDWAVLTVDGTTPVANTNGAGYAWSLFSMSVFPLPALPGQTQLKILLVQGTGYSFCLRKLS